MEKLILCLYYFLISIGIGVLVGATSVAVYALFMGLL